MNCVMCDEAGGDCPLHGAPINERDAEIKLRYARLENEILKVSLEATRTQLRTARRLVVTDQFRRFFREIQEDVEEGLTHLGCEDYRKVYKVLRGIGNVCGTALMDRGEA